MVWWGEDWVVVEEELVSPVARMVTGLAVGCVEEEMKAAASGLVATAVDGAGNESQSRISH